jgi:SAM-dependent methyltransferase
VPSKEQLAEFYRMTYGPQNTPSTPPKFSKRISKAWDNWWFARMVRFWSAENCTKVLEIGCGEGHLLKALNKFKDWSVTGLDYSANRISTLKSLGFTAAVGDIGDQDFADGSFDYIIGFHVLEHVHNLFDFFSEIKRVLRPGGRIYFVVPCVSHYSAMKKGTKWRLFGPPGHLWYFSVAAMKCFIRSQGLNVLNCHCISNRPHLTVVAQKPS